MSQPSIDDTPLGDQARRKRLIRIRRISAIMAWACIAVAVLLTVAMLIYWASTSSQMLFEHAGLAIAAPATIEPPIRVGAFALSMLPLGALIYGLVCARRSFVLFAMGEAFSARAIRGLRSFAIAMAASALLKPVAGAGLGLLLGATSPAHSRSLVVDIGSDTLLALLFAAMVAIIAWILAEATEIANENRQFV